MSTPIAVPDGSNFKVYWSFRGADTSGAVVENVRVRPVRASDGRPITAVFGGVRDSAALLDAASDGCTALDAFDPAATAEPVQAGVVSPPAGCTPVILPRPPPH